MTDLNKLREEFEQLQYIADKLNLVYYCEDTNYYAEKSGYKLCAVPSFVNGAWYAYKKQQAKFDLYMNNFTIAANCVKSQQKTIDSLKAQLDKLESGDYVLVPKEPTQEMIQAGLKNVRESCNDVPVEGFYSFTSGDMVATWKDLVEAAQEQSK